MDRIAAAGGARPSIWKDAATLVHDAPQQHANECEAQGIPDARVSAIRHAANVGRMALSDHGEEVAAAPAYTADSCTSEGEAVTLLRGELAAAEEECERGGAERRLQTSGRGPSVGATPSVVRCTS